MKFSSRITSIALAAAAAAAFLAAAAEAKSVSSSSNNSDGGTPTNVTCMAEGDFVANPYNCSQFFRCVAGEVR